MTLAVELFTDAIARLHTPDVIQKLIAIVEMPAGALLSMGIFTAIVASVICLLQLAVLPISPGVIELYLLRDQDSSTYPKVLWPFSRAAIRASTGTARST
jgi:hypothetical protein